MRLTLAALLALVPLGACVKTIERVSTAERLDPGARLRPGSGASGGASGAAGGESARGPAIGAVREEVRVQGSRGRAVISPLGRVAFDGQHLALGGPVEVGGAWLWASQMGDAADGGATLTDFLPPMDLPGVGEEAPEKNALDARRSWVQLVALRPSADGAAPTATTVGRSAMGLKLGRTFTGAGVLVEEFTRGGGDGVGGDALDVGNRVGIMSVRGPRAGAVEVEPLVVRWLLPIARRDGAAGDVSGEDDGGDERDAGVFAGSVLLEDGTLISVRRAGGAASDEVLVIEPDGAERRYTPARARAALSWPFISLDRRFFAIFEWDFPILDLAPQRRWAGSGRWLVFAIGAEELRVGGELQSLSSGPEMFVPPLAASAGALLGAPPRIGSSALEIEALGILASVMLVPAPEGDSTGVHALWPSGEQAPLPAGIASAMVGFDGTRAVLLATQGRRLVVGGISAADLRRDAREQRQPPQRASAGPAASMAQRELMLSTLVNRPLVPRGAGAGGAGWGLVGADQDQRVLRLESLMWREPGSP